MWWSQSRSVEIGRNVPTRIIERTISDDKFTAEMFAPGPDGKEFRNMLITYTRAEG